MAPVKLYALSTCGHCRNTKKFLDECEISYDLVEVDLLEGQDREDILEEIKRISQQCAFPTIVIGETVIVGFHEDRIREALGL